MAADAREQTASCDAFVLSRRLPAPGAPPCRKSPACLIARTRPSSYLLSPERHLPRMVPAASAAARCEPVPAFPLIPDPSTYPAWPSTASAAPGVSLFRHFRSYLTLPPTMHGLLRHPSLPGVSPFRHFRSYLTLPPILHGPLRHPPLPGVSLFRHFRSYLTLPPTLHGPLRHPLLPGVSRFRRIGSYLRRMTRAPGPALWRRAPGACAERGLVRTGSHQTEVQKLSPRSRKAVLVRTGTEAFGSTKADSNPKLKEVADFCPAK